MIPISTTSRQDYCTPRWLVKVLNRKWRFTLDAAATRESTLARRWYGPGSKTPDALIVPWRGKRIFCNPPYENKRGGIKAWLDRGHNAVLTGAADLVVFLLPANTGTSWFRLYAPYCRTIFLAPRVSFHGPDGKPIVATKGKSKGKRLGAPHASMLVVMDGEMIHERQSETPIRASVWWLPRPEGKR